MAIRQIVKEGDPVLRKISRDVTIFDGKLHSMLNDMEITMEKAEGVGLAAPQIGILRNYAIIHVGKIFLEFVNPIITEQSGEQIDSESCLSVDNKRCKVKRPMNITVEYFDRYGKKQTAKLEGLAARAACHELDHLKGILFYDNEYKGNN